MENGPAVSSVSNANACRCVVDVCRCSDEHHEREVDVPNSICRPISSARVDWRTVTSIDKICALDDRTGRRRSTRISQCNAIEKNISHQQNVLHFFVLHLDKRREERKKRKTIS